MFRKETALSARAPYQRQRRTKNPCVSNWRVCRGECILPAVLTVTYSLADQSFITTKSVGIFNLSTQLLRHLSNAAEIEKLTVLTNPTLDDCVKAAGRDAPRTRSRDGCATEERCNGNTISSFESHPEAIGGRAGRILWDQWGVYSAAKKTGNEWLLLPKGFASFVRRSPVKLAVYVHDTILESYYRTMPGMSRLEVAYFRRCLRASLLNARVILTNTDFTCSEVTRAAASYGARTPRLVNAGIGFDLPPMPTTQQNRIVVLASSLPHKRTALALQYLTRWQEQTGFEGEIAWVGRFPEGLLLPGLANWRHQPRLAEPEYRNVLNSSRVLVFFSDYEGFGMPPVEAALACVCPVYSAIPSTIEVMGGAGLPFNNNDYNDFARALGNALDVPLEQREIWRQKLAVRHNWPSVARKVVEALIDAS